jgi:hypothetical protein
MQPRIGELDASPGMMIPQSRIYAPGQALLNIFPRPKPDAGVEF